MAEVTREHAAALADAICSTAVMNVTLRDFFAAFAMAGIAAANMDQDYSTDAAMAYNYADEMLIQRAKGKN